MSLVDSDDDLEEPVNRGGGGKRRTGEQNAEGQVVSKRSKLSVDAEAADPGGRRAQSTVRRREALQDEQEECYEYF